MMSKITDYRSYLRYFANLAYAEPELPVEQETGRAIVIFDSYNKLGEARSMRAYPVLEVERPSGRINAAPSTRHQKIWTAGFSVLDHADKDDEHKQNQILSRTEKIVDRLVTRLLADNVVSENTLEITPVQNVQGDTLYGWAVSFSIKLHPSFCYDGDTWYKFFRLEPIWGGVEGVLSLNINGELYETDWNQEEQAQLAMKELSAMIMANDEGVNAYVDQGCLMIIANEINQNVYINLATDANTHLPAVFPIAFGGQQHHWKIIDLHGTV